MRKSLSNLRIVQSRTVGLHDYIPIPSVEGGEPFPRRSITHALSAMRESGSRNRAITHTASRSVLVQGRAQPPDESRGRSRIAKQCREELR